MLTKVPRTFILISVLCALLNAKIQLDSVAVHLDGEIAAPADFSDCSADTRESATGVFHDHFWPKINRAGKATYKVTKCLENSPKNAGNQRDFEIVVELDDHKTCTFTIKNDPAKPLTDLELVHDIENQIEMCEQDGSLPEDHLTDDHLTDEEAPWIADSLGESFEVAPEEEITENQAPWVADLLNESADFDPETKKRQDAENRAHEQKYQNLFNKHHANLLGPDFGPFANEIDHNNLEAEFKKMMGGDLPKKHVDDETDSELDDEEELDFLEEQRRAIKAKHADKKRAEELHKSLDEDEEDQELPPKRDHIYIEDADEDESQYSFGSESSLNDSRVSFSSSGEEDEDEEEYDPEEEELHLEQLRKEIKGKYNEINHIKALQVAPEQQTEMKDDIENDILDATATYLRELEEKAIHDAALEQEVQPQPAPAQDASATEEAYRRPAQEVWKSCSHEDITKTKEHLNALISEGFLEIVLIYDQNLKGCLQSPTNASLLKYKLSFDEEICTFLVQKTKLGSVELINNESLREGPCAHLMGWRLNQE